MSTVRLGPGSNDNFSVADCCVFCVVDSGLYRYNRRLQRFLKRALDVIVSLFFVVSTSPIAASIALAIKLTSHGPVLFRQARVGYRGRPFTILKFRSMTANNDPSIHQKFMRNLIVGSDTKRTGATRIENDPRVTSLGHSLRRTCFDEIPQFINVLKGQMSLVGPRPSIPCEYECYENWHRDRLRARPGLTGSWQISDRRQLSFNDMVRLDLEYLHRWSIWLDLKILFSTPVAVLAGRSGH